MTVVINFWVQSSVDFFKFSFGYIRPYIVLILVIFFSLNSYAETYEQMYERMFGRVPEKQYFEQQMGVIVDGQLLSDDISVLVPSMGSDYVFNAYRIIKYLK